MQGYQDELYQGSLDFDEEPYLYKDFKPFVVQTINKVNKQTQTITKEANVSLESKTKWQIVPYSSYQSDETVICFGDVIWLHCIEMDKSLVRRGLRHSPVLLAEGGGRRSSNRTRLPGPVAKRRFYTKRALPRFALRL